MTKYNVKTFNGSYTLVIMDPPNPLHPGPSFTKIPQKVDLTLYFHKGIIDDDSNTSLLRMIGIIKRDLKSFNKLIASHWFENSEIKYLDKEFHNAQDDGHVIDSKIYPITYMNQLEEFLNVLKSMAVTKELNEVPNAYTPLLRSKTDRASSSEKQSEEIKEAGVATRTRKLFGCCLGF